jgi:predicted naringenin-chalcone synthase
VNDCGAPAGWVVVGAAITADGEAATVVLGACDSHVRTVKTFVDRISKDLDETAVVVKLEVWKSQFAQMFGQEIGTLEASNG